MLINGEEYPGQPPELSEAEKLARDLAAHEGKCKGNWMWENGEMTGKVRCASCGRIWEPKPPSKDDSQ